jgi:hypothetical protein
MLCFQLPLVVVYMLYILTAGIPQNEEVDANE